MNISWVISDTAVIDPNIDIDTLKNIGPLWGGWRTWRSYGTDNVICHRESDALSLTSKNFHTRCNLYVPNSIYHKVNRPTNVNLYQGEFHELLDHPDEIVSMHLASDKSDIVLLIGFDLEPKNLDHDRLAKHKRHNYIQYFLNIIRSKSAVQWVLIDHKNTIEEPLKKLSNLQFDNLKNVLSSLL